MSKYIDAEKLKAEIELIQQSLENRDVYGNQVKKIRTECMIEFCKCIFDAIASLQQEQPEEKKLPGKRTRVNYAICKLQAFKPLREAIVLDDYVYDESKCYRENLVNYIHAIPENRLAEIRHYLKEKGWWPYDDDADWMVQEQPEVDLDFQSFAKEMDSIFALPKDMTENTEEEPLNWEYAIARHFYELGLNARKV